MKRILIIFLIIVLTLLANILYSFVSFNISTYNNIDNLDTRIYAKDNAIQGIDEFLHNNFDDYGGYYHYDNISDGRADLKIIKSNYKVLHLNKNIDINDISVSYEGELIDYNNTDYDFIPVYIYGSNTSSIKIGKEFDLALYSKCDDKIINKKCRVIAKIKGFKIPQHSPISIKDRYQVHKNLIIIPDFFREEIFVKDNLYALNLEYNKAKQIESNVFVVIDDSLMTDFDVYKLLPLFLINFVIYIFIIAVLYYRLFKICNKNKAILQSTIIINLLVLILSLLLYLVSDYSMLIIYNISTVIFITLNVFICSIVYYFYRKNTKKEEYLEVKTSYERL